MNINNISNGFDYTIYKRGENYYKRGHVLNVGEYDGGYIAEVEGSDYYTVELKIDDDGNISALKCDCPYGGRCKHEAAVLLYIKNEMMDKKESSKPEKTASSALSLIKNFSERAHSEAVAHASGSVQLVPEIKYRYGRILLSLKIGRTRLYVVKNIYNLCNDFKYNYHKKYGKEFEFTHEKAALDPTGKAIIEFIENHGKRYYGSNNQLELYDRFAREFLEIFDGKTIQCDNKVYEVRFCNPPIRLRVSKKGSGYELSIISPPNCWDIEEGIFCYPNKKIIYAAEREYIDRVCPVLYALYSTRSGEKMFISESDMNAFYSVVLLPITDMIKIAGEELLTEFTPPQMQGKLSLDRGDGDEVYAMLEFIYDDKIYPAFENKTDNPFCNFKAETELEALALKYFDKGCPDKRYNMTVCGDEKIYSLLTDGIEEFSAKAEVYATDKFRSITVRPPLSVTVGIRPVNSLLEIDIDSENYDISELAQILSSYRKGRKFHRMRDGSFARVSGDGIEELSQMLSALNISDKALLKGKLTVPQYRMFYLDSLQKNYDGLRIERNEHFREAVEKYGSVSDRLKSIKPPAETGNIMRGYQKYGFLWLKTIKEYGFGGILADDMGLGKTLQAIALILDEKENNPEFKSSLVVCPSSLTLNWISEIDKFAPGLKAAAIIGTAAERDKVIAEIRGMDVVITSYAALMRDIEKYEDIQFGLYFIDEAQYIKNHTTQSAKAVKAINSETRFALTGTPVENSLAELWSIFDFIMPDYLFGYSHFKSEFETKIVRESNSAAAALLGKMTAPFILRRLKKEVLKELPDKTETILAAEMDDKQKKLYTANLLSLKSELSEKENFNDGTERFQVLAMLTKLRQICCDPSLLYENYDGESSKLEQCMELTESCVESGHKVLIFSQFTSMLDIIADRLDKINISYFMLTGKTKPKERICLVNRFNGGTTSVFLISLKAGGTGLNLTSADIVIHYDPWWNVSAENQASDRVYRIGQKNNVQIYKLIAKNTIEEKIQELQKAKAELAELVLNPKADITKMSAADIMALLE